MDWHVSTEIDLLSTYCIKLCCLHRIVHCTTGRESERVCEDRMLVCRKQQCPMWICLCLCVCYTPCVFSFVGYTRLFFMQFPINGITIIKAERFFSTEKFPSTVRTAVFVRLLLLFIECRTMWNAKQLIYFLFSFILFFAVDDASGHYTPGLFYGNHYWIGSLSLCNTIYKAPSSITPFIAPGNSKFTSSIRRAYRD